MTVSDWVVFFTIGPGGWLTMPLTGCALAWLLLKHYELKLKELKDAKQ